ncbi:MAG: 25S rRNA (adenine645-N1)-methyltransferase [Watsoniomyces obsoletus]|nr:MAG: 25S rRNA (adenine645-N1)-methyltransferase [Watsoniomyces obsoletus]
MSSNMDDPTVTLPEEGNVESGTEMPEGQDASASAEGKASTARSSRKRTKTGCLTCRRRRIKCGEERPICNNCVKSKRNCEGYSQRVVFKDPMSGYHPGHMGFPTDLTPTTMSFPHYGIPGVPPSGPFDSTSALGHGLLPAIAPRPPPYPYSAMGGWPAPASAGLSPQEALPYGEPTSFPAPQPYSHPSTSPYGQPYLPAGDPSQYSGEPSPLAQPSFHDGMYHASSPLEYHPASQLPEASNIPTGFIPLESTHPTPPTSLGPSPDQSSMGFGRPHLLVQPGGLVGPTVAYPPPPPPPQMSPTVFRTPPHSAQPGTSTTPVDYYSESGQVARLGRSHTLPEPASDHGPGRTIAHVPIPTTPGAAPTPAAPYPGFPPPPRGHPTYPGLILRDPIRFHERVEYGLNDPGVVTTDPEDVPARTHRELGPVMALQAGEDRNLRTFTNYLAEPNMLATYRPSPLAAQLRDPMTGRIFCHFLTATGPSMSIFERHPANPSVMFSTGPVPSSQRSLWTYTLPTLALNNQPLMHAMLAMGALHICKLQGGSTVPSLKHYHIALRLVAHLVSAPSKRGELATLAATLLLGFWEVMAAEHAKWNSHLLGARQLLDEYDFAGMTKRIKALSEIPETEERRPSIWSNSTEGGAALFPDRSQQLRDNARSAGIHHVDEDVVGIITGQRLRYSEYGQVVDERMAPKEPELTRQDLEDYETRRDLFWWFVKQDTYQSILSGNRLLSNYERWSHCPPRAALGRREAIYGTSDHMILLLGRVAEFSARDQLRKRKVMEAATAKRGGPSGTGYGFPPSGETTTSSGPPPPGQLPPHPMMPIMYGMVPSTGQPRMPAAFRPSGNQSPPIDTGDDMELEAAAVEAEGEWNEIREALRVFEESLGPHFQPLSAELMPPLATPFGPALHYRTYSIAAIWALYNLAHIVLERAHPSMSPIAMMAAGAAAVKTAGYANEMGRIVAGLGPTEIDTPLNPNLGGALLEASLGLFFAGIQYQDAAQRAWTVSSLRDTARRTGWDSIGAIAAGCERAWLGAANMGFGPPYTPAIDTSSPDDRIAMRSTYAINASSEGGNAAGGSWRDPGMRVYWAIGVMGVEEDLAHLSLH